MEQKHYERHKPLDNDDIRLVSACGLSPLSASSTAFALNSGV